MEFNPLNIHLIDPMSLTTLLKGGPQMGLSAEQVNNYNYFVSQEHRLKLFFPI